MVLNEPQDYTIELVDGGATGCRKTLRSAPSQSPRRVAAGMPVKGTGVTLRTALASLDEGATPSSEARGVGVIDGYTVSVYFGVMIQSFADFTTADLWEERNSKAARRVPRDIWPTVRRKLTMLDAAQRLDDLAALPGNRLEALVADRRGSTAFA